MKKTFIRNDDYYFKINNCNPEPHKKGNNFYEVDSRHMRRKKQKLEHVNPFHQLLKGEN